MAPSIREESNDPRDLLTRNGITKIFLWDGLWENGEDFDKTVKNPSPKWGHLLSTWEISLETK
jgi:hypothetical protein